MRFSDIQLQIKNLTKQLVTKYAPEKIILFGSATQKNNENEINDIDLFIVKKDVPHFGSERISQLYRIIDTPLPVDYIVYRPSEVSNRLSLGDPFIVNIVNNGEVLYG